MRLLFETLPNSKMWKVVLGSVLLVGYASALNVTKINNATDAALPAMNKYLTELGLGLFLFEGVADEAIQLGPGVQIGLNTLQRRGDCFVTNFGNSSKYVDFSLGFGLFVLGFGEIHMRNDTMAGLFKVNKNAGRLSYWVHEEGGCRVELDHYEITELEEATLISSDHKYDGMDVSRLFREYGRGRINHNMLSQREAVQKFLQTEVCNHHRGQSGFGALHKHL